MRCWCTEHVEDIAGYCLSNCAPPTGVDMVASPEILRNAQPPNVQAAPNPMGNERKQRSHKTAQRPEPEAPTRRRRMVGVCYRPSSSSKRSLSARSCALVRSRASSSRSIRRSTSPLRRS
jgi:hypothetical protein